MLSVVKLCISFVSRHATKTSISDLSSDLYTRPWQIIFQTRDFIVLGDLKMSLFDRAVSDSSLKLRLVSRDLTVILRDGMVKQCVN